jgi:hypothetical protein
MRKPLTTKTISLSASVSAKLKEIARKMGGGYVDIGFFEGSNYPDGTAVASVAFWNEFGTSRTPARPFFRQMIAKESPSWPHDMAETLKTTGYDGGKTLALMGEEVDGALRDSIFNADVNPLAASTIRRKGSSQPLVDTGTMSRSSGYRVEEGDVMQFNEVTKKYEARD